MDQINAINYLTTESSITIFWDKPEDFSDGDKYQIILNRSLAGTDQKTHYILTDLKSDTTYNLQVNWIRGKRQVSSNSIEIRTQSKKKVLDISQEPYHAIGDGKTMNTRAIQRAIDDCTKDCMVYIPKGIFMTAALKLHSNMELYLDKDATLQGTDNREDYLPKIPSRFEGQEMMCYSSLLNLGELNRNSGYNCQNVVIRGEGTIASGGKHLAEKVIEYETENLKDYLDSLGDKINECEKPWTIPGRARPRLINISNCQNISISGLILKDAASWNVHMIYSDHIVTDHCTIYSRDVWNGDGWDPDSSTNCTIFACTFYTGDDGIAIKSGKNPEGNEINRPCSHIRIFDCKSACGHGITIGSEMSGGVEDVYIWDCDMMQSRCGIEIKGTKKRGGYIRNVIVRDCSTARILFHSVEYNDDGIGAPVPPVFSNCTFQRIQIAGRYVKEQKEWFPCEAIELCGFDEPGHELRDILFEDIRLGIPEASQKQSISLQYCENVTIRNISVK